MSIYNSTLEIAGTDVSLQNVGEKYNLKEEEILEVVTTLRGIFKDTALLDWIIAQPKCRSNLIELIYKERTKIQKLLSKTQHSIKNTDNLREVGRNFFEYIKEECRLTLDYEDFKKFDEQ